MINPIKTTDFAAIKLRLASPDDIHGWSHGEVTKPETINYRTQRPEKDGLFDERIFGPTKDWECYCGKYKKIRYKGIVCDKCGVEVTRAIVRRERMGHIDLAVPVSHIWFLRGVPSRIGLILDMSVQNLEKVVYFANFIITKVDENLKKETLEQIKQEYKAKQKGIENEFNQQVNQIKSKQGSQKLSDDEVSEQISLAAKTRDSRLAELGEIFSQAERELKDLKPMQILSESSYQDLSLKYGHVFEAGIGGEAIRSILEKINLAKLIVDLEKELLIATASKKERLIRRIKVLKSLEINKIRPESMVLATVPVIPPDLRPMVPLDGGRFATSDLNDLYRRVINRNNRLKQLIELKAPEVISRNEKRMLQEAVDALIDNSARHGKTVTASTGQKRMLKSLADMLKGKQGRFRQNLLGKRTDYSGRSVIVVGPNLLIDQCGLPKKMALELFKPFIISKLIKAGFVHNVRSAGRFIEGDHPEVWDILEEIIKGAYVLLNRAPTLHRLGIQAFKPVLIEGKSIQIHPLVCAAFNADFDGDQMAVHVPLTEEAVAEARDLMLSSKNLLKPATGDPVAAPSKDIVWGCHYLTYVDEQEKVEGIYSSPQEAIIKYNLGFLPLRRKIKVRFSWPSGKPDGKKEFLETSVGRIIFNQILPEEIGYINGLMDAKELRKIITVVLGKFGQEFTAEILDRIKKLGFEYITLSGLSWGMDDVPPLTAKKDILAEADKKVDEIQEQYEMGLLTQSERYTKVIDVWTQAKDKIVKASKEVLPKAGSVYTMVESGARGSWGQLTQIVGMKGLVTNPAGEIIELPVKGSFKEGFNILEYFISTHGARKGLSDTALRTANAGYLTRRLVDVAQDVIIREEDCGTSEGLTINKKESTEIGKELADRAMGRYLAADVKNPKTGKVVLKKNEVVIEGGVKEIRNLGVEELKIRSVLTCVARKGVCQMCYGYDLGYNKLVAMGTAVGIIAAQSIGEPGTQLTMRTFHTGGVVGQDITQGLPRVEEIFEGRPPKKRAFMADVAGKVKIEEVTVVNPELAKRDVPNSFKQKVIRIYHQQKEDDLYPFWTVVEERAGAQKAQKAKPQVKVKNGDAVKKGQLLLVDTDGQEVAARREGVVKLEKDRLTVTVDEQKVREYPIQPGYAIYIKDGDQVEAGDALTEGSLDLQQLFRLKNKEATQKYVIKEIQLIYSSQGQRLNDKHVEIIARQMFSRLYVKDAGDTTLLPGEIVEKSELNDENERVKKIKGRPAEGEVLLLGITKVSLTTRSFLSAASFQETARVLINAAITGKVDNLEGLKENVIIGRLIPVGRGFGVKSYIPPLQETPVQTAKAAGIEPQVVEAAGKAEAAGKKEEKA